jgi:hypothetical protein
MWESINNKGHWIGEIHNKHKNGEIYIEHMHITAVKNSWGEVTHYTGIFTDRARNKKPTKKSAKAKISS